MKRLTIYILLLLLPALPLLAQQNFKVLFLGNSYTSVNNLPEQLTQLTLAAGDQISCESNTPGGCSLGHPDNGHLYNQTSLELIDQGNWDFVILQDQSQMPIIPHFRDNYTYPGSEELHQRIKEANACTEVMFYMTWGRKNGGQQCIDGYCSAEFEDFNHMQDSLEAAYMQMGNSLHCPVSPVGIAWKNSIASDDPINLFASDQSHPNPAGTYLAACTFYASIFQKSPVGIEFYGLLTPEEALNLQEIAAYTVLENPELWNLNINRPASGFNYQLEGPTIYCQDQSSNASTVHWDFGDGITSTQTNPSHEYTQDGNYELMQISSNECFSDTTLLDVEILYFSIDDQKDQKIQMNYFPLENQLQIVNASLIGNHVLLSFYTNQGQLIHSRSMTQLKNIQNISIPDLAKGLIIIRLQSKERSYSKKFIVI
ncbi:MAG: PKD domain-containing protein [Bacteroidales bacterium]|nr:PKD domain-containing protein [Bacteroidales bacterium]